METKVFEVEMPASATIEAWRGVTAKIMLLVRRENKGNGCLGRDSINPSIVPVTNTHANDDEPRYRTHATQVRSINVKEEVAPDGRSPEERLAAAREELAMKARVSLLTASACLRPLKRAHQSPSSIPSPGRPRGAAGGPGGVPGGAAGLLHRRHGEGGSIDESLGGKG